MCYEDWLDQVEFHKTSEVVEVKGVGYVLNHFLPLLSEIDDPSKLDFIVYKDREILDSLVKEWHENPERVLIQF